MMKKLKKLFILSISLSCFPIQVNSTVSQDWEKHIIGEQSSPICIDVKDMDGDKDLDVVVAGLREDQMIWYENKIPKPND